MLVDIDKVVVKDRIRKDFGDIKELATDIKENGLINPPVVTPDLELIAGERRLRAMKFLKWPQVEVRVMTVQDALHQLKLEISENENRKEFTFSEKMEWAERLKSEYSKIAAANQKTGTSVSSDTQVGRVNDKVAGQVGMSASTLTRGEYIVANADEEMIRQLDEKELSINAAYVKLKKKADEAEAKLKEVEQERDNLAQEAVEATRAVKASTDSEEYLRMRERVKTLEEEKRIEYEKQQLKEKEEREARKQAAADRKAEIEKIKADAEAQVKAAQEQMEKASKILADAEKGAKPKKEVVTVTVEPDDYEELKLAKLELDAIKNSSEPDISKQIMRIHTDDRTPEQKLNSYEKRLIDGVGGFLSEVRGFEVQFDLCSHLPVVTKRLLRENIANIQQILTKMDNAIMEGEKEWKTA